MAEGKSPFTGQELDQFITEIRDRQRNIVFPDTVKNSRSADVFLWRGSSDPTVVQRIAACLFGLLFVGLGLCFLSLAAESRAHDADYIGFAIFLAVSGALVYVGLRMLWNGLRKRQAQQHDVAAEDDNSGLN